MLATPFVVSGAPYLAERFARMLRRPGVDLTIPGLEDPESLTDHVIIVGYGISGKSLARVLRAAQIPYVVLEQNGQQVRRARAEGIRIRFGDGTRREVLERVGIEKVRVTR